MADLYSNPSFAIYQLRNPAELTEPLQNLLNHNFQRIRLLLKVRWYSYHLYFIMQKMNCIVIFLLPLYPTPKIIQMHPNIMNTGVIIMGFTIFIYLPACVCWVLPHFIFLGSCDIEINEMRAGVSVLNRGQILYYQISPRIQARY